MRSFCGENAIGYIQKRSFTVDPRLAGTRRSHNAYAQLALFHLDDQITELCFARSVLCARVLSRCGSRARGLSRTDMHNNKGI